MGDSGHSSSFILKPMSSNGPLVWIDLEMTGLDPDKHAIVEIATIVTDARLEIVETGPNLIVHQPESVLEQMSSWSKQQHSKTGLLREIRNSEIGLQDAERRTLNFVRSHVEKDSAPLCGNSIGQDRRFLYRYMPELSDYLHYRNVDVSSIKELVHRWYPSEFRPPDKEGTHRALGDIKESIEELRWYRQNIFNNSEMRQP